MQFLVMSGKGGHKNIDPHGGVKLRRGIRLWKSGLKSGVGIWNEMIN